MSSARWLTLLLVPESHYGVIWEYPYSCIVLENTSVYILPRTA